MKGLRWIGLGAFLLAVLSVGWLLRLGIDQEAPPRAPSPPAPESADELAEAWRAVAEGPEDPSLWLRLGELQQALDQNQAAERSFRTAIELGDPEATAQARLGFLLYGSGRDREALVHLAAALEQGAELPLLRFIHDTLRDRLGAEPGGLASGAAAPGPVPKRVQEPSSRRGFAPDLGVIAEAEPFEEESEPEAAPRSELSCAAPLRRIGRDSTFLVDVVVDGLDAELIVDTGASLSVITEELANALGLVQDWAMSLHAVTANGTVEFPTAVLQQVSLQGRSVSQLRVAVCRNCVERVADGLLGLDLQTAFGLQLDLSAERLGFEDCR
ncbi:MAG: aspartyl protease family protein [Myxococcota bacterium]